MGNVQPHLKDKTALPNLMCETFLAAVHEMNQNNAVHEMNQNNAVHEMNQNNAVHEMNQNKTK